MTKYRHKPSGKIVVKSNYVGYYQEVAPLGKDLIPNWVINKSSDWELIADRPVLFRSGDNIDLYEGDTFYMAHINSYKLTEYQMDKEFAKLMSELPAEKGKVFAHKVNAEIYLMDNAKVFSLTDIKELSRYLNVSLSLFDHLKGKAKEILEL